MQQTDDFSTDDQLRLLQNTMHRSNPNVLFVRYLSFLRDRGYQGALDSLHQYHDALSPRQDQSLNDSDGKDGDRLPSAPPQIVGSHFRGNGLQYAGLNLVGLQITFDHFNAAHESIQEVIRVAQHHGDRICVAFALAGMIRINQKVGETKENIRQLVGSSLDRSKELRLPALQVLATLTEVEGELMRCSTTSRPGSASHLMSHVVVIRVPSLDRYTSGRAFDYIYCNTLYLLTQQQLTDGKCIASPTESEARSLRPAQWKWRGLGKVYRRRFSTMFGSLVEKLRSVQWLGEVCSVSAR
ncbi:hypothetical protein PsorP6_008671 [Peronosclerospora sorghi]|uniref:Uncharacterized protein n=1 Tax=Peronosclerospora sorghi TaxID=230839 RepID=A0ACC0W101_9STRA|nr:hypothetical protein PsorP6_008671 [Peronosclerospora sorghi]